jgi:hypothetical protein
MCSNCKDILVGFQLKHESSVCPLKQSTYCGICALYGHTTINCIDEEVLELRKPNYIEQLIPPSIREEYNIKTKTKIQIKIQIKPKYEPVLEVINNDKYIRAILQNNNITISGKAKENRLRLQKLAEELGRKLLFIGEV